MRKSSALLRIPAVAAAALVLLGCPSKKEFEQLKTDNQKLTQEKQQSQKELSSAGAATSEMQTTLDEVQRSLQDLRAKELKAVKTSLAVLKEGQQAPDKREELRAEIEEIRKSVRANLAKLATLERQKRESENRVGAAEERATTLERLVTELRRSLQEKEAMIAELESKTLELTKTAEELRGTVKEKEVEIADRETQMSTAYVLIAGQKALKQAGLVEKKGSVLGLGGNWQRTGQFDETLFKKIDTRAEKEFSVAAATNKAKVLSDHPKDSYELKSTGAKTSTLTVLDPVRFWKGSKYLVVMLPD